MSTALRQLDSTRWMPSRELIVSSDLMSRGGLSWGGRRYELVHPDLLHGRAFHWLPSLGRTGFHVSDASGKGGSGTMQNMEVADWRYGHKFDYVTFDGTNEHATLDTPHLEITGELSVSVWLRTVSSATAREIIIATNPSTFIGWAFGMGTVSGKIGMYQGGQGGYRNSTASVNTGAWVNAVAVTDLTPVLLYVNGHLDSSHSGGSRGTYTGTHYLGGWPPYSRYFDGDIAEVCVWSTLLSPSQVRMLHDIGPGGMFSVKPLPLSVAFPSGGGGGGFSPWLAAIQQQQSIGSGVL